MAFISEKVFELSLVLGTNPDDKCQGLMDDLFRLNSQDPRKGYADVLITKGDLCRERILEAPLLASVNHFIGKITISFCDSKSYIISIQYIAYS